ncbi:MAG: hypothetical protein IKS55_12375 [Oscillospiraceae bacterium]|nr:hypothetical protein [Oscillospiraceae bacterium]
MKKIRVLSLVLCLVLLLSVSGAAAFAAEEVPADKAELVEQIKEFQKAHPEYETAYYDILDATDLILREELAKAFRSVQREWKKEIMAKEEETGIPLEDRQRFAGLCETMAFIVNRDFSEHYKSAFVLDKPEYFDGSGETQVRFTADYDEAYQAIAERFRTFLAERGRGDGEKELFTEINLSLSKAMDEAFDRANDRLKESFDEIAEDYNFSEEDKEFVGSVMAGLLKDVNANFLSSFAGNRMEAFDPEIAIK